MQREICRHRVCRLGDPEAEVDRYAALLRKCGETRDLVEAKRLELQIRDAGYSGKTFLGNLLLQAYGKCGSLVNAKAVFDCGGFSRNLFTWNIAIAAFVQNGKVQEAEWLFDSIPAASIVSWTTMVGLYAQTEHLQKATSTFNRMPQRNTVSWNSMLLAYAQTGDIHEALGTFDRMVQRDLVSWNSMVTAYVQGGLMPEARAVLDKMPQWNSVPWNATLSGHAEAGHVDDAIRLFDLMPHKDVVSWTAMMSAYARAGDLQQALELFKQMDLEGTEMNQVTLVTALNAAADLGSAQLCRAVHSSIIGLLPALHVEVWTGLLNLYCKCGLVDEAVVLFESMENKDAVASTVMIAAYGQSGCIGKAKAIFDGIPSRDLIAWNAVLGVYACNGLLEDARRTYEKMPFKDVGSWNSMLVGYTRAGQTCQALKELCSMDLEGLGPDKITVLSVLEAFSAGNFDRSVLECSAVSDVSVANAFVHMFGRRGELTMLKQALQEVPFRDQMTWNIVISAYARNGHLDEAMSFFRDMCLEGEAPNEITSITILSACSHAGWLQQGLRHFASLSCDFNIVPTTDHRLCLLDMLARSGQVHEAEQLVKKTDFGSYQDVAWKTLLTASSFISDVERAACFAKHAVRVRPDDPAPYILLSNMYSEVS